MDPHGYRRHPEFGDIQFADLVRAYEAEGADVDEEALVAHWLGLPRIFSRMSQASLTALFGDLPPTPWWARPPGGARRAFHEGSLSVVRGPC